MKKMELNKYNNFSKGQVFVALGLIVALFFWGKQLSQVSTMLPMHLITGISIGYILTRSRYGFAGGIKRIYVRGEGSLTYALLVALALTTILYGAVQWLSFTKGALPAYLADGGDVIPGTQNVFFTNIGTIIGGYIFGIGMIIAGGCASGTLTDFGEGEGHAIIALPFFVLGAVPGHFFRYAIDKSAIGKVGFQMWLPERFGFIGAFALTFAGFLFIYWMTKKYEDVRLAEGTSLDPKSDYEDFEKPLPREKDFRFFSWHNYYNLFVTRWSFVTGSVLLSIVSVIILIATGKAWGVTSAFTKWGVAILQGVGMDFSASPAFSSIVESVNKGLLQDGGTIRNIGILLGALIAFLMAGRLSLNFKFRLKDAAYFALGGLLMGVGSRMAKGCNIGALYSSITNFSLSGWIFMVALTLGGLTGLKTLRGKVCLIPASHRGKTK